MSENFHDALEALKQRTKSAPKVSFFTNKGLSEALDLWQDISLFEVTLQVEMLSRLESIEKRLDEVLKAET